MQAISYFRLSLAVPLLVPLFAVAFNPLNHVVSGSSEATANTWLTGFLPLSLIFGGVPYLVFAGAVLLWSRGRTARAIYGLSFVSPLLFTAVFVTLWTSFILIAEGIPGGFEDVLTAGGYYALICVGLGYVYVALVHAMYAVLRRLGKVQPIAPA